MKQPRGTAGGDFFFFLFFIIVLGVVWAMTGGPGRDISRAGPFLNPPFPFGEGTAYTVPGVSIPKSADKPKGGSGGGGSGTIDDIVTSIKTVFGTITEEKSLYAGSVTLTAGRAKATSAGDEYVILKTSKTTGQMNISDWRLESTATGVGAMLGDAVYLPFAGQANEELSVAVGPGTTMYIGTGLSPLGVSFRVNICSGYFETTEDYSPKLKNDCPAPEDELEGPLGAGFVPTDACSDFVARINQCEVTLTGVPIKVGSACEEFIYEDLTYNGCVAAHKSEPDFYKNEWYIYLDRSQELWKSKSERIRLVDESGKVITSVSY